MALMKYGKYKFEVDSAVYQSLSRKSTYKWSEEQRTGKKPSLIFANQQADTISLPGVIYPHHSKKGLQQINILRQMAAARKSYVLVNGDGKIVGDYVIVAISEKQTVFTDAGQPLKIEFTLSLKEQSK